MQIIRENLTAIKITDSRGAIVHGDGNASALRAIDIWAAKCKRAVKVAFMVAGEDGRDQLIVATEDEVADLNEAWGKSEA